LRSHTGPLQIQGISKTFKQTHQITAVLLTVANVLGPILAPALKSAGKQEAKQDMSTKNNMNLQLLQTRKHQINQNRSTAEDTSPVSSINEAKVNGLYLPWMLAKEQYWE
jgi:hypothetical protein